MRKLLTVAALAALSLITPAAAQHYPSKPITFLVPFAAGGPTDTLARIMAAPMGATLGQTIVVENAAGAGGSTGVARGAQAAPDGYIVTVGNWSTHVINGAIYNLNYDLLKDFEPVILLPSSPQLIVARKSLPASNLSELIAWLKANKATVGSAGIGSAGHVSSLFFENKTGIQLLHVPYRGAGPAMQDLVSGQIDIMFDQSLNSLPQIRAGTIKAFAVTKPQRLPSAPDIPTVDEAGLKDFYISVWGGLWVPKGTPREVIDKLNGAARKALADPALQKRIAELGQDMPATDQLSPEALGALQKAEIDKWWPIVKKASIKTQ